MLAQNCKMIFWLSCIFGIFFHVNGQIITISLAGTGSTNSKGRVQITRNGITGTVCRDKFDDNAAKVVCRQLGFPDGGSAVTDGRFGPGNGPIWLDDVICQGSEAHIELCMSRPWGDNNCNHNEDVGVTCQATTTISASALVSSETTSVTTRVIQLSNCTTPTNTIRLKGPANLTGIGFVEVNRNGAWRAVCDDSWGTKDAMVVCRMLCYDPSIAQAGAPPDINVEKSQVVQDFWLDDVECVGTETDIADCPQATVGNHNCDPNADEFASVTCIKKPREEPSAPNPLLECANGNFYLSFSLAEHTTLEERHLSLFNEFNGTCNIQTRTANNIISVVIDYDECGTATFENATHLFYTNAVRYAHTEIENNIARDNTYRINITCCFPRALNESEGYTPPPDEIDLKEEGRLSIIMKFYNDSFITALTAPITYTIGTLLNVALTLEPVANDLKLVVSDCKATPSNNRFDPVYHNLFIRKCASDTTVGFFPLNATSFGFSFKTFKFLNHSYVVVHCDAWVCRKSEKYSECDRSCNVTTTMNSGRRKRHVPESEIYHLVSPPVMLTRANDTSNIEDNAQMNLVTTSSSTTITTTTNTPVSAAPTPASTTRATTSTSKSSATSSVNKNTSEEPATVKLTTRQTVSRSKNMAEFSTTDDQATTNKPTMHLFDPNKLYIGGLGGQINLISKAHRLKCSGFPLSVLLIIIISCKIMF